MKKTHFFVRSKRTVNVPFHNIKDNILIEKEKVKLTRQKVMSKRMKLKTEQLV